MSDSRLTTTGCGLLAGGRFPLISIIIPARNEALGIGALVQVVATQRPADSELEIIIVDDGSIDGTGRIAAEAGAKVVTIDNVASRGGNPALARNRGAAASRGDPLVFLDSDCTPHPSWLDRLLSMHARGIDVVGGSLALPSGLSPSARCDYYNGWYHVHPKRPPGFVKHHPPCNVSVRRAAFAATSGFVERQPVAYAHEELLWQAEIQRGGGKIFFEPSAVVDHHNRPGFGQLLRRSYRWGFGAIEAKAAAGTARFAPLYRHPWLLLLASPVLAVVSAFYILGCWLRAGVAEPLWMLPILLAARASYAAGMVAGGLRRIGTLWTEPQERRPRWQ